MEINPEVTQFVAADKEGARPVQYINIGIQNSKIFKNKNRARAFLAIHKLQKFKNFCFFKLP